jgi:hypothetical protein
MNSSSPFFSGTIYAPRLCCPVDDDLAGCISNLAMKMEKKFFCIW